MDNNLDLDVQNNENKKNIRIKKTFLKRKRKKKQKNKNSFIIPYSDNEINNPNCNSTGANTNNNYSFLSIESLSFSCIPKKKEKSLLEEIINYVSYKNQKLISIFGGDNIKERESKRIMELKQEIAQKNLEISLRE